VHLVGLSHVCEPIVVTMATLLYCW